MKACLLLLLFIVPVFAQQQYESLDVKWPSKEVERSALWKQIVADNWQDCVVYNARLRCRRLVSTPQPSPTPTPTPSPTPAPLPSPSPTPSGPRVVRFRLATEDGGTVLSENLQGAQISRDSLPNNSLAIYVDTEPSVTGSVRINYFANANHVENGAPYTTAGFVKGSIPTGSVSITAQAFSGPNLSGTAGASVTVTFTVAGSGSPTPTPTPSVSPTPVPSPTPLPSPTPTPEPGEMTRITTVSALIEVLKGPGTPGETICLSGRFSRTASQLESSYWVFRSELKGTADKRITLTTCPGETAIIDGNIGHGQSQSRAVLWLEGQYTDVRGLEITNSSPSHPGPYAPCGTQIAPNGIDVGATGPRFVCQIASSPWFSRGHGINDAGLNNRILNNIIHDNGNGIFSGASGQGSEIYGNIIFYNGWEAPDRAHGHGIYAQNSQNGPVKLIEANVIHSMFGFGAQAYSGNGYLDNIQFVKNVIFDGGLLQKKEGAGNPNLTINGGASPAKNLVVRENFLFFQGKSGGQNFNASGGSASVQNNLIAGAPNPAWLQDWTLSLEFTGNTIVDNKPDANAYAFALSEGALPYISRYTVNRNNYLRRPGATLGQFIIAKSAGSEVGDFAWWKQRTGFDAESTFALGLPLDKVTVIPNKYEQGRSVIVVENWSKASTVSVSLQGLADGQRYEIRDPRNLGRVHVSGTFDGNPITIPLTGLTYSAPVGLSAPVVVSNQVVVFVVFPK